MKALVIVVGLAVAIILAVDVTANIWTARFRERYEAEKADLNRRARAARSDVFDAAALNNLPPPVRRYLEVTRSVGKPQAPGSVPEADRRATNGRRQAMDAV